MLAEDTAITRTRQHLKKVTTLGHKARDCNHSEHGVTTCIQSRNKETSRGRGGGQPPRRPISLRPGNNGMCGYLAWLFLRCFSKPAFIEHLLCARSVLSLVTSHQNVAGPVIIPTLKRTKWRVGEFRRLAKASIKQLRAVRFHFNVRLVQLITPFFR